MIQYPGLSSPIMPPRPEDVGAGWMGSCLPPTRRKVAIALLVGLSVFPLQPPAAEAIVAPYAGSAAPPVRTAPPIAHRVSGVVLPSTLAQGSEVAPQTWRPTYPDQVVRKVVLVAQRPAYHSLETINANPGTPGGSSIAVGAIPLLQYQSLAAPFTQPVGPAFTGQPLPASVDFVRGQRTLHASLHRAYAADQFDPPASVTTPILSWEPQYPDVLFRKAPVRLGVHELQATIAPQIDLTWKPIYPDRYLQQSRRATYVWGEPHFVVEVPVPVMSWTGVYLDPPMRAKPRRQTIGTSGPLDPSLLTQPTAPPEASWDPVFSDLARPLRRSLATLQSGQTAPPLFIPDQTNPVTVLSWSARYRDFVPGRPRLIAGAQPAFFTDVQWTAPAVVAAPAVGTAVYPDRVHAKARPTKGPDVVAPILVADVTQVVTALSWRATYADRVFPPRALLTAAQLALMMDAQIFVPSTPATPATPAIHVPRQPRAVRVRDRGRTARVPRRRRGQVT